MTDKQIMGGRGSAKSCTTLNTIEVMLENEKLKEALKAKEQECETLKSYANFDESSYRETNKALLDEIAYLNKELADYKRQHQGDKGLITSTGKMNYQLLQEYDKLKTALTEIKEIAEKCCIMQTTLDCENYDDCTQCGRISDGEGIQQIFQKISEEEE